jgi:hypothetical protein
MRAHAERVHGCIAAAEMGIVFLLAGLDRELGREKGGDVVLIGV